MCFAIITMRVAGFGSVTISAMKKCEAYKALESLFFPIIARSFNKVGEWRGYLLPKDMTYSI
jgi:hypothetical protein